MAECPDCGSLAYSAANGCPACRQAIPEAELLEDLRRVADEDGRTPSADRYTEHGRFSVWAVQKHFGSWNAGVEAAGLALNRHFGAEARGGSDVDAPVPVAVPCPCGSGYAKKLPESTRETASPLYRHPITTHHFRHAGCDLGGSVISGKGVVHRRLGPVFNPARYGLDDGSADVPSQHAVADGGQP